MNLIDDIDKKSGRLVLIFWGIISLIASFISFIFGIWVLISGNWEGILIILLGFIFLFLSIYSFRHKSSLTEIINRSWGKNK